MLAHVAWLALFAAGGLNAELKAIDKPCDAAAKLDDAHRRNPRAFADLSAAILPEPDEPGGDWRAFASPAAMKTYVERGAVPNTQANLWSAADGTTIAEVRFQGATGEWSDTVEYCFRADGSLARVDATLEDISAEVTVQRTTHYAPSGAERSSHARAFDWEGKRLKNADTSGKVPVYKALAALPFLKKPTTAMPDNGPAPRTAPLDAAAVDRLVRSRVPAVRACYERALATKPGLAGRLDARFTIDGTGATRDVSWAADQLHDPAVAACAAGVIAGWRFSPPPAGPMTVTFPFVFQPPRRDGGADAGR
jgi:hypothetical protein